MAAKKETGAAMMNPFSGKPKVGKKILEHIRISRSMDGGFQAHHHHTSYEHPPEIHQFEPEEGEKMIEHIRKHLNIEPPEEEDMGEKSGGKKMAKGGKGNMAEEKEDAEEEGED